MGQSLTYASFTRIHARPTSVARSATYRAWKPTASDTDHKTRRSSLRQLKWADEVRVPAPGGMLASPLF
jgi:hypothetical protein